MRIIAQIELREGKCIRIPKVDFEKNEYFDQNPLDVAKAFENYGIEYLQLVDLDGSKLNRIINYKALESISSKTRLKIDFRGGVRSNEDLHIAFNSGAKQITSFIIALKEPRIFEEWLSKYGSQKIILGTDSVNEQVKINGGMDIRNKDVIPIIKHNQTKSLKYVICTNKSKNEFPQGPAFQFYKKIINECSNSNINQSIKLIAAGGIQSTRDLEKLMDIGCEAVILGNALYENKISLNALGVFV